MPKRLLRHFSFHVYFAFCPLDDDRAHRGAETYLIDLWRYFPKSVALSHTLLCIAVYFLPAFTFYPLRVLSRLPLSQRNIFVTRLLTSRIYFFRLVAYAVKGHALVAIFRDADIRHECKTNLNLSREPRYEARP